MKNPEAWKKLIIRLPFGIRKIEPIIPPIIIFGSKLLNGLKLACLLEKYRRTTSPVIDASTNPIGAPKIPIDDMRGMLESIRTIREHSLATASCFVLPTAISMLPKGPNITFTNCPTTSTDSNIPATL